ncbi:MAG: phosphoenolpyruvate--protein phosphotransferase [Gammaproteobacteria bacterium]|nr:phosphoenolpyruvate--protein phosphotransferase [Gammaproteobacteria bacterium]
MITVQGIGITKGCAIGTAHLLRRGTPEISRSKIEPDQTDGEIRRFQQAVNQAKAQLKSIKQQIPSDTPSNIQAFIDTHLLMLKDALLAEAPIEMIRQKQFSAEWALQSQRDDLVRIFDEMDDPYLRTRKDDIDHVVNRIQKILLCQEEVQSTDMRGKVILAQDLTPADTILMRHQGITAFITEYGGPMSHTAILARSLGIPAVVGVHHATRNLKHGEQLVVDGSDGLIISGADTATLDRYQERINADLAHQAGLQELASQPALSADGISVQLMANIELPEDIDATCNAGADGVGLYRTEYLYMNRSTPPDEAEHYQAYYNMLRGLKGIPLTIRTLDLGADKGVDGDSERCPACNPALGLRAIRLCMKEPQLFLPQLRAILRVGTEGPVRIMIPMLSTLNEIQNLKQTIERVKQQLTRENTPFSDQIPIGGMIEVPAAALAANVFARELDFLSIGTNDLIQYTLAVDRMDDEVNYLYDPLHPSVLKLIQMVLEAGNQQRIPVAMCGEMAGEPDFLPLLMGMGLREFSMQPGSILETKKRLGSLNIKTLQARVSELFEQLDEPGTTEQIKALCNST